MFQGLGLKGLIGLGLGFVQPDVCGTNLTAFFVAPCGVFCVEPLVSHLREESREFTLRNEVVSKLGSHFSSPRIAPLTLKGTLI